MSRGQRIAMLVLAAVIAVGALVLLGGSDDDEPDGGAAATTPTETAPAPEEPDAEEAEPEPEGPEVHRIRVRNGRPVGGIAEIEVKSGDIVRLLVTSDTADRVHVHGYDLFEDVAAGGSARFRFRANLEGLFEVELEDSKVQLAELRVEP